MKRKSPPPKKKSHSNVLLFILFISVALLTVVVLEYLDHRGGKSSFIFDKLLSTRPAAAPAAGLHAALKTLLHDYNVHGDIFQDKSGVYHCKFDVADGKFDALLQRLLTTVKHHGAVLELEETQSGEHRSIYLYRITSGKRVSHLLLMTRLHAPASPPAPATPAQTSPVPPRQAPAAPAARLAIVIDDVGYREAVADELHALNIPITAAVIPFAPYAAEEAAKIKGYGLEAIIHLPMQPAGKENHTPRNEFVFVDSSDEEIAALLRQARAVVPDAAGLNNHMGSLVTANREAMQRVLQQIRRERLFFIDSKTTAATAGYALARQMGIKTRLRDIFLDDIPEYAHSMNQIRQLVGLARQNGSALAIGHPFESTLRALRDSLPALQSGGVRIVFASELLE